MKVVIGIGLITVAVLNLGLMVKLHWRATSNSSTTWEPSKGIVIEQEADKNRFIYMGDVMGNHQESVDDLMKMMGYPLEWWGIRRGLRVKIIRNEDGTYSEWEQLFRE